MENLHILKDFVLILMVSIPVVFLFQKIKFPSIVGFIIAGVIIGPGGLKLISDTGSVNVLAEIGVVLLLFAIGLEFSLARLVKIGKLLFVGGSLQVFLTAVVTGGILYLFSGNAALSVLGGFLVSLSSTAIVLKSLADRKESDSPFGNISLGILLFQDLFVIPLMVMVPFLKDIASFKIGEFFNAMAIALAGLVAVYFVAGFVLSRVMHYIVRLKNREIFTLSVLAICLGTAYFAHRFGGLSLSIGAFLAGIILSKTDYSHQVISDIIPFKDCFNSVFFVSIGMLLGISFLTQNIPAIFGGALALTLIKVIVIIPVVLYLKFPLRIAVITGLCLSQIGEFSFVLGKFGSEFGIMSPSQYEYFIAVSVVSMVASPFFIMLAPKAGLFVQDFFKLPAALPEEKDGKPVMKNHVIIIGFGLNGKNLSRVLHEVSIKHVIVDLDAEKIQEAKDEGDTVLYGDFTKREILESAGIHEAKVAVIAISDPIATEHGLWLIKEMNPHVYTVVRTRSNEDVGLLLKIGAEEVIPEEFETSIEIFSRVLSRYHVPRNVIDQEANMIRKGNYDMFRSVSLEPNKLMDLNDILNLTLTETMLIKKDSKAIGKTLVELNLRAETGTTVIAVVRDGKATTNPKMDYLIAENDVIVVLGNHAELDKAVRFVSGMEE